MLHSNSKVRNVLHPKVSRRLWPCPAALCISRLQEVSCGTISSSREDPAHVVVLCVVG
ncbi:hypothetical protein BD310DRAFT_914433 [Dichomitus squalens]|uniref:Uncharacterized protein n=1 Tax=Dichomitus squalens TaxID=114155 RepID=A0A4V2K9L6_9APHY|nr:hypothetical protein BD310DRAFT_914433 [Dichomitus squalens]